MSLIVLDFRAVVERIIVRLTNRVSILVVHVKCLSSDKLRNRQVDVNKNNTIL